MRLGCSKPRPRQGGLGNGHNRSLCRDWKIGVSWQKCSYSSLPFVCALFGRSSSSPIAQRDLLEQRGIFDCLQPFRAQSPEIGMRPSTLSPAQGNNALLNPFRKGTRDLAPFYLGPLT
jgi:hypothetical protein